MDPKPRSTAPQTTLASDLYLKTFGAAARHVVRSPLRVCPLGAHVDHQDGVVTAMALDECVDLAFDASEDGRVRVISADFPGDETFGLDAPPPATPSPWGNYLRGAARVLQRRAVLRRGIRGVVSGSLPVGGLSSSAAVTTAYLMALAHANELEITPADLIRYGHQVEREFIGLNNGILDPSANVLSRDGFLLRVDCRTEASDLTPRPPAMPPFEIAIVHSGISTPLICTDYNRRVSECREAARRLLELGGRPLPGRGEAKLRDVPAAVHREFRSNLPDPLRRRADHFFSEMERVDRGAAAWARGDLSDFGEQMSSSGESSIRNYECGCPELITIYETLRAAPGVAGARFSGAGYRGACVAIIDPARRDDVAGVVHRTYPAAHPRFKDLYRIYFRRTGDGARIEPA